MIPILWRYLLKNYLKVFFLSIFTFIFILLLMRMQEIARFATLGSSIGSLFLFVLMQFPLILPLAIPLSALIASILLVGRLNHSDELTSLRSQGLSLKEILYPLKFVSLFLALLNFVVASEITPTTRLKGKNLIYQATAHNPLVLLKMNKMTKLKGSYAEMSMNTDPKEAKDLIFGFINPKSKRTNLILAESVTVKDQGILIGKNIGFISSPPSKDETTFDHLVIENCGKIENSSYLIASLLHESEMKRLSNQKLRIRPLIIRTFTTGSFKEKRTCILEIFRRGFLGLATYSFTMLGAVLSIQIGRKKSKKGLFNITLIASIALISYLLAKASSNLFFGLTGFIAPHLAIYFILKRHRKQIESGVEA